MPYFDNFDYSRYYRWFADEKFAAALKKLYDEKQLNLDFSTGVGLDKSFMLYDAENKTVKPIFSEKETNLSGKSEEEFSLEDSKKLTRNLYLLSKQAAAGELYIYKPGEKYPSLVSYDPESGNLTLEEPVKSEKLENLPPLETPIAAPVIEEIVITKGDIEQALRFEYDKLYSLYSREQWEERDPRIMPNINNYILVDGVSLAAILSEEYEKVLNGAAPSEKRTREYLQTPEYRSRTAEFLLDSINKGSKIELYLPSNDNMKISDEPTAVMFEPKEPKPVDAAAKAKAIESMKKIAYFDNLNRSNEQALRSSYFSSWVSVKNRELIAAARNAGQDFTSAKQVTAQTLSDIKRPGFDFSNDAITSFAMAEMLINGKTTNGKQKLNCTIEDLLDPTKYVNEKKNAAIELMRKFEEGDSAHFGELYYKFSSMVFDYIDQKLENIDFSDPNALYTEENRCIGRLAYTVFNMERVSGFRTEGIKEYVNNNNDGVTAEKLEALYNRSFVLAPFINLFSHGKAVAAYGSGETSYSIVEEINTDPALVALSSSLRMKLLYELHRKSGKRVSESVPPDKIGDYSATMAMILENHKGTYSHLDPVKLVTALQQKKIDDFGDVSLDTDAIRLSVDNLHIPGDDEVYRMRKSLDSAFAAMNSAFSKEQKELLDFSHLPNRNSYILIDGEPLASILSREFDSIYGKNAEFKAVNDYITYLGTPEYRKAAEVHLLKAVRAGKDVEVYSPDANMAVSDKPSLVLSKRKEPDPEVEIKKGEALTAMKRIAVFDDVSRHTPVTQRAQYFGEYVKKWNAEHPDRQVTVRNPTDDHNGLNIYNGAITAFAIAEMLAHGGETVDGKFVPYSIEDIFDPTKLSAEKAAAGTKVLEKYISGNSEYFGELFCKFHDRAYEYVDEKLSNIDFSDPKELFTHENRLLHPILEACWDMQRWSLSSFIKPGAQQYLEKHPDPKLENALNSLDSRYHSLSPINLAFRCGKASASQAAGDVGYYQSSIDSPTTTRPMSDLTAVSLGLQTLKRLYDEKKKNNGDLKVSGTTSIAKSAPLTAVISILTSARRDAFKDFNERDVTKALFDNKLSDISDIEFNPATGEIKGNRLDIQKSDIQKEESHEIPEEQDEVDIANLDRDGALREQDKLQRKIDAALDKVRNRIREEDYDEELGKLIDRESLIKRKTNEPFLDMIGNDNLARALKKLCIDNRINVNFETGDGLAETFWIPGEQDAGSAITSKQPFTLPVSAFDAIMAHKGGNYQGFMKDVGSSLRKFTEKIASGKLYVYLPDKAYPSLLSYDSKTGVASLGAPADELPPDPTETERPGAWKSFWHKLFDSAYKSDFDEYERKVNDYNERKATKEHFEAKINERKNAKIAKTAAKAANPEAKAAAKAAARNAEIEDLRRKAILKNTTSLIKAGLSAFDSVRYFNSEYYKDLPERSLVSPPNRNNYILIDGVSLAARLGKEYRKNHPNGVPGDYVRYLASNDYVKDTEKMLAMSIGNGCDVELYIPDSKMHIPSKPSAILSCRKEPDQNVEAKKQAALDSMKRIAYFNNISVHDTLNSQNRQYFSKWLKIRKNQLQEKERNNPQELKPGEKLPSEKLSVFTTSIMPEGSFVLSTTDGVQAFAIADLVINKHLPIEEVLDPTMHLAEKSRAGIAAMQAMEDGDDAYFGKTFFEYNKYFYDKYAEKLHGVDITDPKQLYTDENSFIFLESHMLAALTRYSEKAIKRGLAEYFKAHPEAEDEYKKYDRFMGTATVFFESLPAATTIAAVASGDEGHMVGIDNYKIILDAVAAKMGLKTIRDMQITNNNAELEDISVSPSDAQILAAAGVLVYQLNATGSEQEYKDFFDELNPLETVKAIEYEGLSKLGTFKFDLKTATVSIDEVEESIKARKIEEQKSQEDRQLNAQVREAKKHAREQVKNDFSVGAKESENAVNNDSVVIEAPNGAPANNRAGKAEKNDFIVDVPPSKPNADPESRQDVAARINSILPQVKNNITKAFEDLYSNYSRFMLASLSDPQSSGTDFMPNIANYILIDGKPLSSILCDAYMSKYPNSTTSAYKNYLCTASHRSNIDKTVAAAIVGGREVEIYAPGKSFAMPKDPIVLCQRNKLVPEFVERKEQSIEDIKRVAYTLKVSCSRDEFQREQLFGGWLEKKRQEVAKAGGKPYDINLKNLTDFPQEGASLANAAACSFALAELILKYPDRINEILDSTKMLEEKKEAGIKVMTEYERVRNERIRKTEENYKKNGDKSKPLPKNRINVPPESEYFGKLFYEFQEFSNNFINEKLKSIDYTDPKQLYTDDNFMLGAMNYMNWDMQRWDNSSFLVPCVKSYLAKSEEGKNKSLEMHDDNFMKYTTLSVVQTAFDPHVLSDVAKAAAGEKIYETKIDSFGMMLSAHIRLQDMHKRCNSKNCSPAEVNKDFKTALSYVAVDSYIPTFFSSDKDYKKFVTDNQQELSEELFTEKLTHIADFKYDFNTNKLSIGEVDKVREQRRQAAQAAQAAKNPAAPVK